MNKLFLVLLCSSYLCANSQTQVVRAAFSHSCYEPEHRVCFTDMKDWKIIEPERESCMSKYVFLGVIALAIVGIVGIFFWEHWSPKEPPPV